MIAVIHQIEEDVSSGEIAMHKTIAVQTSSITRKIFGHAFENFRLQRWDFFHRITIIRTQTHKIVRSIEPILSIAHESYRFRSVKTTFLQHQRRNISTLRLITFVETSCQTRGKRHTSVAFHHKRQTIHLKSTKHIAPSVEFAAISLKMFIDLREIIF